MNPIFKKLLCSFWTVVVLFLMATWITDLEVTNHFVNKGLIYILILGLILLLAPGSTARKLTISIVAFGLFLVSAFFLDLRGDWKAQTVIFKNKHLYNRAIESQLQDKGALGYNRRVVDRIKLFPFVSWIKNISQEDLKTIDSLTWDKVDIYLNEQELKGG